MLVFAGKHVIILLVFSTVSLGQGDALSPVLFAIVLIVKLRSSGFYVICLVYMLAA